MALGSGSRRVPRAVRGTDFNRRAEIFAEHGLGARFICYGARGKRSAGAARADLEAPLDREVPEARNPLVLIGDGVREIRSSLAYA